MRKASNYFVSVDAGASVESIVYRKTSIGDAATPGVLFLHGGPHAAVQDAFSGPLLALVAEGYTLVLPNYRGSAGYGESHLSALPGHAGKVRAGRRPNSFLLCGRAVPVASTSHR